LEVLEKVAGVAASAHAPFIAAAGPGMFGWESYPQLNIPRDMEKIFESNHYIRWRMFREREDSRYVGLALPHILLREPYGSDSITVDSFRYEEKVDGTDHSKYLWGNAAYALAARITDSFSRHQWCVTIRGVEGGGLVEGLPLHTFDTEDGEAGLKCPTEIAIPYRREAEFSKLGFIPLCHEKRTDRAVFFGLQSTQKAQLYLDDKANANANLSTQLPYIFAVSRFAHYLKAIAYDKIGSYQARGQFERFLNDWIHKYVLDDDFASQDQKAQYPLREARIEVAEIPGKPGAYSAIAYLRPHFQLDALKVSMRLVAELPQRKE
jgi:type VI secretion system protein ImpC